MNTVSSPPIVDTHCHLDFDAFANDVADVVARAETAGVLRIIVPTVDLNNAAAVLALAGRFPQVFAAVGVHPNSTADWLPAWLETVRALAGESKVVAVGEIGLDYYWDKSPRATQQAALEAQLEMAARLELPVIVHNREASDDVIKMLAASPLAGRERAGVLHSFSADWRTAADALDLGFHLGFTGPLTYKKADELREVAARAPLERLLVETDAPFLSPQPYRGRRNEPAYVRAVVERLAELRGLEYESVARQTTANAVRLFGLPAPETDD